MDDEDVSEGWKSRGMSLCARGASEKSLPVAKPLGAALPLW